MIFTEPTGQHKPHKVSLWTKFKISFLALLSYIIPIKRLKIYRKIKGFREIKFPIVKRTFGNLIPANEIVSCQPMNAEVGLLFKLEFVYKKSFIRRRNTVTRIQI